MRLHLRPNPAAILRAALVAVIVAAGALVASTMALSLAGAGAALAKAPPWEPDPGSVGALIFYNAAGKVITSGNINDSPIAAYVAGTNTIRAGDTKATLFGYLPVHGLVPGQWSGEALGASTAYPNTSAPAPLKTSKLPVETGSSGDESVAELEVDFPNNDHSGDGYAGIYQLRLRTSGHDEGVTVTYDSADIQITGDTWSVIYSPVTTATTLLVSPTASAFHGSTVKLSAKLTPATATGSVQFRDGSVILSTVAVKAGIASFSTAAFSDGVHRLSARFVPANSNTEAASVSSVHAIKVSPHPTTTSLVASKSTITKGQKLVLTARESPAVAGSVTFYDGSKKLAVVKVSKGAALYSSTKLSVGAHSLRAMFTPLVKANDTPSSSKVVKVTVKK